MKGLALYSINKFFAINAGRMVTYMNQTLQSTSQLAPRLLIWMTGLQGRALIIKEDVISSR
ncbi:hypothetical protein [Thorsellia anophelis]|uniref:Uncharacterized protein n=1 Tax=Thorsellia anophelis DSM 18579 TaxID=1123402 RepID=A0A1I0FB27_9GAMM|nr:hypothetical protein [Thorsellia anophelis]SET55150.1 hypothetical protein SAMN02583745_02699 [Thorsellia anophelis DSM 18579]